MAGKQLAKNSVKISGKQLLTARFSFESTKNFVFH